VDAKAGDTVTVAYTDCGFFELVGQLATVAGGDGVPTPNGGYTLKGTGTVTLTMVGTGTPGQSIVYFTTTTGPSDDRAYVVYGPAAGTPPSTPSSGQPSQNSEAYRPSATPTAIPGISDVVSLSAVQEFLIAADTQGRVWTFGRDLEYGIQGNGDMGPRAIPPVQVPGLTEVTAVSADLSSAYALKSDGTVWAWGRNTSGSLGDGTRRSSPKPVRVQGLPPIARLVDHRSMAVSRAGDVWTWGSGSRGLGTGSWADSLTPKRVPLPVKIKDVWAGPARAYALGLDGSLWAWGTGGNGSMGNGTVSFKAATPFRLRGVGPVQDMIVHYDNTFVLLKNGRVRSWGTNYYGELGINRRVEQVTRPVTAKGLSNVVDINAVVGTVVATAKGGAVWTWGKGPSKKSGEAIPSLFQWKPTKVAGIQDAQEGFAHVVTPIPAFNSWTGYYAVDSKGQIWAWGNNTFGTLGLSGIANLVKPPTRVPIGPVRNLYPVDIEKSVGIVVHDTPVYAVLADGSLWTWGWTR
jgi:alpha-tubulin suppressor-like RCC1 family protein